MQQPIRGYSQDEEGHWVAWLACGHRQHVRHCPPRESRVWVLTAAGRASRLGLRLACRKCDAGLPPDVPAARALIERLRWLALPAGAQRQAGTCDPAP